MWCSFIQHTYPVQKRSNVCSKQNFLELIELNIFGSPTKKRKVRKLCATAPSALALEGGIIVISGILNKDVNLDPPLDKTNKDGDKCNSEID